MGKGKKEYVFPDADSGKVHIFAAAVCKSGFGSVVQWIEWRFPVPQIQVRSLSGLPCQVSPCTRWCRGFLLVKNMVEFKSCIFNLDGVLVNTAKYHYIAWRRLANEWGFDLSPEQHEQLRWLSRMESLEKVMEWGGITYMTEAEKLYWADVKNSWYIQLVSGIKPEEVFPGVIDFLLALRAMGVQRALSSASGNARTVLISTGLLQHFEVVTDGTQIRKNKPHPESYMVPAAAMGLRPSECLVFDDAPSGIDAALIGGFSVVGVGEPQWLHRARLVVPGFENLSVQHLFRKIGAAQTHELLPGAGIL